MKGEKLPGVSANWLLVSPFGNEGVVVNPIGSKSKLEASVLPRKVARLSRLEIIGLDK